MTPPSSGLLQIVCRFVTFLILEDDHVLQTDQHTAALALLLSSKIQISFWWRKVGAGESIAWCNL